MVKEKPMELEMSDQDFISKLKQLNLPDIFIQDIDKFVPKVIRHALTDETITAIACAWLSAREINNTKASIIENKSGGIHDYITSADKASHDTIFGQLESSGFLDKDEVLSEESETLPDDVIGSNRLWVIDELDGTNNIHRQIDGLSSNCIGFAEYGKMQSVAVCIPDTGNLMFAQKGLGTYLNGKRVSVSSDSNIADTAVATDYYFNPSVLGINLKVTQNLLKECTDGAFKFQALGSAVTALFHVAHGGLGVYFHSGLSPWDNAAKLLVEEANGFITNLEGEEQTILDRGIIAGKREFVELVIKHTKGEYTKIPKIFN